MEPILKHNTCDMSEISDHLKADITNGVGLMVKMI